VYDDETDDSREQVDATPSDLNDETGKRIEAYVRVGREEQLAQIRRLREQLEKERS
jgi:hypothetical protein